MRSLLRKLGRLLRLAAIASVVIAVVRAVMGRRKPEVTGEASWPPLVDREAEPVPAAGRTRAEGQPIAASGSSARAGVIPRGPDGPPDGAGSHPDPTWVEPVDGACPASHPIKGNDQSKIYHVPGGASYERTVAERCYASAEAAEADGFRAAKR